jgi:hypothetical protein
MARQLSDDQATPALPAVADQSKPQRPQAALDSARAYSALAVALATGFGLGAVAALALQAPTSPEASLANLLHGIVGIKALIFAGALALVALRLRGPVHGGALAGYCLGLGMSAAALAWLWGLSGLLVGSALFYGGLVVAYQAASRDPLLVFGFKRVLPSERPAKGG